MLAFHESNGSRISIAVCLFNPGLDFKIVFHKNEAAYGLY